MTEGIGIELLEGETLEDAVKRMAAEIQPKPKKKSAPKKGSKFKPARHDPSPPVGEGEPEVYACFHMYLLTGRSIQKLRSDAARERSMYGPGVQVFLHAHQPGETCGKDCAERVE